MGSNKPGTEQVTFPMPAAGPRGEHLTACASPAGRAQHLTDFSLSESCCCHAVTCPLGKVCVSCSFTEHDDYQIAMLSKYFPGK